MNPYLKLNPYVIPEVDAIIYHNIKKWINKLEYYVFNVQMRNVRLIEMKQFA